MIPVDITRIRNLSNCTAEVTNNLSSPGPIFDFSTYVHDLLGLKNDLRQAANNLRPVYQEAVAWPFLAFLDQFSPNTFYQLFTRNNESLSDDEQFWRKIIPDICAAIFASCPQNNPCPSHAFQEVVSDLYEGFMCEEDRSNVKRPDLSVIPPLVLWGNPQRGPYTWTIGATLHLGLKAPIVSLPAHHANGGLLGWSTLGHEVGGHDIIAADRGLLDELKGRVQLAVFANTQNEDLATYWENCTSETASDVLGLLNMGPAAGIGLIGYFRGRNANRRLRTEGPYDGPHPVAVLRGFIAARVVAQLQFSQAAEWSRLIEREARNDLQGQIRLHLANGETLGFHNEVAIRTAQIAADTIATARLQRLEGHSLIEIQNWRNRDERICTEIQTAMLLGQNLPQNYQGRGYYATHVVAAAVTGALRSSDPNVEHINTIFNRMKAYLVVMNRGEYTPQRTAYLMGSLHALSTPQGIVYLNQGSGVSNNYCCNIM
ncbi:MAG: hypothetical protein KDK50_05560 [Chlamydiia bacterium]|nr:hypothetical protein [Chlamydiia bacterium]